MDENRTYAVKLRATAVVTHIAYVRAASPEEASVRALDRADSLPSPWNVETLDTDEVECAEPVAVG